MALQAPTVTSQQPASLSPLALSALAAVDAILGEDDTEIASWEEPAAAMHHAPDAQPDEAQDEAASRAKLGAVSHEIQCIAEDGGADHEQHRANGIAHADALPGKLTTRKAADVAGQNGEMQTV